MDDDSDRQRKAFHPAPRAPLAQFNKLRVHPDHQFRSPGGRPHPEPEVTGPPTEAIVAAGRSIHLEGFIVRGPGQKVTLPLSEILRLRELGFVE